MNVDRCATKALGRSIGAIAATHCVIAVLLVGCLEGVTKGQGTTESSAVADVSAEETRGAKEAYFENHVRPLLVSACLECHGAREPSGGLRLDSRSAMLQGGERGTPVKPGHSAESLLVQAIRRDGELQMPPDQPLAEEQVKILSQWIDDGAIWPEEVRLSDDKKAQTQRDHWAFQPVRRVEVPKVGRQDWCRQPIDAFVMERLETAGLTPSPQADRRTLIRRATYDLTGLPPTPAEVEAFERDPDPRAYELLIERLLRSPHYGEQWARHWLDVARYSDTKGYVYAREERFYIHAWAYRDWVVRAFNEDLPYNQFLSLQIAADQIAPADPSAQAAMGFLTLGRRFLGVTHDIIDDRIDVVCRGTMGLTVGCARCHDHKYDPIPTADYYSLYGVFRNSAERRSLLRDGGDAAFHQELAARQKKLDEELAKQRDLAAQRARKRVTDYLIAQTELQKHPEEGFDQLLGPDDLFPSVIRRWEIYLAKVGADDPVFGLWHALQAIPDAEFEGQVKTKWNELREAWPAHWNVRVRNDVLGTEPPTSKRVVAERYGRLLEAVESQWRSELDRAQQASQPSPATLGDASDEAMRQVLYGATGPCAVPDEAIVSVEYFFPTRDCEALWKLQGEVDRWLLQSDGAQYVVTLGDRAEVFEPRILRRGNPANKGEFVPRQFLSVIAGAERKPFREGSGRRELAEAIVDPQNPLTARVWVNRIWLHHFGRGLVRTPSDFGLRADPPSHPELLDWLAGQFVENGWSTKDLHRQLMLSATYQQSSFGPEEPVARETAVRLDPDNRLLWRMNARRLSFEEMRDTMLAVCGQLDPQVGGRARELFPTKSVNTRRTVYGLVDRQFLPGVHRMFDFANPDLHIPQRSETTVPQQALFALNHPYVAHCARTLAERSLAESTGDAALTAVEGSKEVASNRACIERLFVNAWQRLPTDEEVSEAREFVQDRTSEVKHDVDPACDAWQYGFAAVDEVAERLGEFHPLPYFDGHHWQGGNQFPDATLGWLQLSSRGGHPGNDLQHAIVRRWIAPRKMTVRIDSLIQHEVPAGDGIRAWIFSSRAGKLGSWLVHQRQQEADVDSFEVMAGETIDFVVDIHRELNSDQFLWAPRITEAPSADPVSATTERWDAEQHFSGPVSPHLTGWEQLAQILLLANEFMFVD